MDIEKLFNLNSRKIKSEKEFIKLIEDINTDIEFNNLRKSIFDREKLLDKNYLLKRYREIKRREDKKSFREKHDCEYCLYYEKPRRCFETRYCPLEEGKDFEEAKNKKKSNCPKDKEGNCPYANDVGTCFGFCMVEIIKEVKERKDGK